MNQLIFSILLLVIAESCSKLSVEKVLHAKRRDSVKEIALCELCNVNICFAIDGSSTLSPDAFHNQKDLVQRIVNDVTSDGSTAGLAGVQFGASNREISSFTTNKAGFLQAVESIVQLKQDETFLTGGLNFCISELLDRHEKKNNILLMSSGRSSIGSDPSDRSDAFLQMGGKVFVVGVGESQNRTLLLQIAGGDEGKLFEITEKSPGSVVSKIVSDSLCQESKTLTVC